MTNLLNVIKKDFIGYRKTLLWALFYIIFFPFCFMAIAGKEGAYNMVIVLAAYMVVGSIVSYDEKYKTDMLVGVLPLKRSTIILAKVLELDIVYAFTALFYILAGYINSLFSITLYEIPAPEFYAASLLSISILGLLLLPLSYKFGYQKSRMMSFVVVFFTVAVAVFMFSMINISSFSGGGNPFEIINLSLTAGITILAVISVAIQILTYFITKRIYEHKDF